MPKCYSNKADSPYMLEQVFKSLRGLPLGRQNIFAKDKECIDRFIKCVCGGASISQAIHYYYGRYCDNDDFASYFIAGILYHLSWDWLNAKRSYETLCVRIDSQSVSSFRHINGGESKLDSNDLKRIKARCYNYIGIIYVTKYHSIKRAAQCYKKSADLGYASACSNLGGIYMLNLHNYRKAFRYYHKAIDLGYIKGYAYLANLYLVENEFVKKDINKALVSLQKAGDLDDELLSDIYFNIGFEYFKSKDYHKAFEFFKKSADLGYASAYLYLGFMYQFRRGVKRNDIKAMCYYKKAEKLSDKIATLGYVKDIQKSEFIEIDGEMRCQYLLPK